MLAAASLELKAEKPSAHSGFVQTVAFSPDGKTIVSGSEDKTLKVWDSGVLALPPSNPQTPNLTAPVLAAASLELKAEKKNAHGADKYGNTGFFVGYSPDGAKVVSSGFDGTLKVWDAGVLALTPSNP